MQISQIINEVFQTKLDLSWHPDGVNGWSTTFNVSDQEYGITIRHDDHNGQSFYDVSFHIVENGGISHAATNFGRDQFKILGVVTNGIKKQIPGAEIIYFAAKRGNSNSDGEYRNKAALYSRLARRLAVENNMVSSVQSTGDETVYVLAKTQQLLNQVKI